MKRTALIVWLALAIACASVPAKQHVSDVHQSVRLALTAFDDLEHALCAPAPAVPHDCQNPQASQLGLTSALNQQIGAALVKAYDADKKVSAAIIAWKAGDPPPSDLQTLLADVQATFDVVKSFAPSSTLLAKAQSVLDEVNKLVTAFAGGAQ